MPGGDLELAQPGSDLHTKHPLTNNQACDIAHMRSFIGNDDLSKAYKDLPLYALLAFDSFSQLRILSASKANNAAAQAAKELKMNAQEKAFALAWTHAKAGKRVSLGKEKGNWVVKILKTKA